jgi:tryptophan-rich sensory protein
LCSWSIVFFSFKLLGWSLIVLGLIVLITSALTQIGLIIFGRKVLFALVPLLLWTSFAFYLNLVFYSLNS